MGLNLVRERFADWLEEYVPDTRAHYLAKLGERTLYIDCDVLEADGGTRTAAINGAYIALVDALASKKSLLPPPAAVLNGSVAAISVGLLDHVELLDLDYSEDKDAEVDLNRGRLHVADTFDRGMQPLQMIEDVAEVFAHPPADHRHAPAVELAYRFH